MKSIPSRKELLDQIIMLLKVAESGLASAEIDSRVADKLNLDESARLLLHSGTRTKYSYEMAWARTMGKKDGRLVLNGRLWSVANETISS